MALIEGIKVDGTIIKDTLSGIGGLARDIRTAITGKMDPGQAAELEVKLAGIEAAANKAQTDVNAIEAANPNVFVSGWRPAIGWVCGMAMAAYYIPQALLGAVLWLIQCIGVMNAAADIGKVALPPYPVTFNMEELIGLILSLLGLGVFRMGEKFKGVARS